MTTTKNPIEVIQQVYAELVVSNLEFQKAIADHKKSETGLEEMSKEGLNQVNIAIKRISLCASSFKNEDNADAVLLTEKAIKSVRILLFTSLSTLFKIEEDKQHKNAPQIPLLASSSKIVDDAQELYNNFSAQIAKYQLHIFAYLQLKDTNKAKAICDQLTNYVLNSYQKLITVQAILYSFTKGYSEKGVINNLNKLGLIAAKLASLEREYVASFMAAYEMQLIMDKLSFEKDTSVLDNILFMPFDMKFPNGKDTTVDAIHELENNSYIEVEGWVKSIEMLSTQNGQASSIVLKNLKNSAEVIVQIPFVNASAHGLGLGAYCLVNGTVKNDDESTPTIVAQRLKLSTILSKSWRVSFLRLSEPLFHRWDKGINMLYSKTF